MKVVVDLDVCQGYVCCVMEAPTVFDVDDATSKAVVLHDDPPEELRAEIEAAARSCPARAIRLASAV
jgi:ferredoxin